MAATQGKYEIVKLESTAGTGTFYTTTVNPKNQREKGEKLKLKKYDKKIRKHVIFLQVKIK